MSAVLAPLASALVTRWRALPSLTDMRADERAPVIERGMPIGGLTMPLLVAVEFDGTPESQANATFEQEWLDLSCTRRREVGELVCSAIAQTGDKDIDRMETLALQMVAACSADLRSDLTVGGIVWSQYVARGTAQQLKNERGVAVLVPFTVAYAAAA